jgi:lipid II:glycine glycyltransferase (peptidoglycan interpeptide bridge formation enzyme)
MQPKQNFIIDIDLTEDELLAGMKSKTRYNVRLAKRKGVEILVTRDQKYIDKFIDLVEQTAQRKGVSFHQREHYLQMFQNIPEDVLKLYVAEYEGEVIAANIISFYGEVATYLHGATSDQSRNVMAPFLLQWQAILDAKKQEIKHYDFGGIFPESSKGGQQGITRFKLGFSPKTKPFQTAGSHDIILNKSKYWMYRFLQRVKK